MLTHEKLNDLFGDEEKSNKAWSATIDRYENQIDKIAVRLTLTDLTTETLTAEYERQIEQQQEFKSFCDVFTGDNKDTLLSILKREAKLQNAKV